MNRLLEAELIYGRLLPIREPHLVARYNKALVAAPAADWQMLLSQQAALTARGVKAAPGSGAALVAGAGVVVVGRLGDQGHHITVATMAVIRPINIQRARSRAAPSSGTSTDSRIQPVTGCTSRLQAIHKPTAHDNHGDQCATHCMTIADTTRRHHQAAGA